MPTKILVIDDDEDLRQAMVQCLRNKGYLVTEASNGEEGLRRYRRDRFDLVVTDIVMPDKEGLGTIMELLALNPAQKIIAVSGGGYASSTEYLDYAREFGARRVLSKPFTLEKFLLTLAEVEAE